MLLNLDIYTWIFVLVAAAATTFASLRCIHMLQLESYQGNMYRKWIRRAGKDEVTACFLCGIIALLLHMGWVFFYYSNPALSKILEYGADAGYVLMMAYIGMTGARKPAKKKLVFTGRVLRLLGMLFVLAALFHCSFFLQLPAYKWSNILFMLGLRYLPGMLLPFFVLLTYYFTLPVENAIKHWYFRDAQRILRQREDLIKIGITGSYGKTSTKFILGTILQEQMQTLVTPGSFNTPMGVTRIVREQLDSAHNVFVAEMGARYKGDIRELCELVGPQYGIITSLGKQHLETFGSYETLLATKAELIQGLGQDGAIFLNGDNADCRSIRDAYSIENMLFFGLEGDDLYMRATDIEVGKTGSTFNLVSQDGETIRCNTKLLGKHNISNIAAAAGLAHYIGMPMERIAAGIEKLEPVEHRLQLIEGAITVIDDAFNANPAGTKAALEVLRAFHPAKRIIVTPGMIELGKEEEALNEMFGRDMAHAADIVILVGGQRVEPIRRGLLLESFPQESIVQVLSLQEASEKLPMHTSPGCVVLFENDLPDNYDNA